MHKSQVLERLDINDCKDPFQIALHKQRYEFALGFIRKEDTLLEIGTGLGVFSSLLESYVKIYNGIEYDPETCRSAQKRLINPNLIQQGDAQDLKIEDNSYSCVVCLEVLEHLPNYRKALDNVVRVMGTSGRFLASIPYRKFGAPSKTNPYHVYEPGEQEFIRELHLRFKKVDIFYQLYPETGWETTLRTLHLRRLFGVHRRYERLTQGHEDETRRLSIQHVGKGLKLGIFAITESPVK